MHMHEYICAVSKIESVCLCMCVHNIDHCLVITGEANILVGDHEVHVAFKRLNGFQQAKYLILCNIMAVSMGHVVELIDNEFTATNQNAANHAVKEFLHNINILQEHDLADTAKKLKENF